MTDIQALFDRDPLECTDSDILALINEYRKRQSMFKAGDLKAGSSKPKDAKPAKFNIGDIEL